MVTSKFWYSDGTTTENYIDIDKQLHRTDGPAAVWSDGYQEWRQYDQLHRTDGPAITHADGTWQWFIHGQCTCYSGPAKSQYISNNSTSKIIYSWCIEDQWMSQEEFKVHPKNIEYQMNKLIEESLCQC